MPFSFRQFPNRRLLTVLTLGFSAGLPLSLVGSTLQAWLASVGIDVGLIGAFSLLSLPYAFKFLWAPLMDWYVPPFLGRRRGWLLLTQLGLIAAVAGMAGAGPAGAGPAGLALFALLVAFLSASQDIVVDAYCTEVFSDAEYGAGAGWYMTGYRGALLVSGAGALVLSDHVSWRTTYLVMATLLIAGLAATLLGPEPLRRGEPPRRLRDAVWQPLAELRRRHRIGEILAFTLLYKLGDVLAGAMLVPFALSLGFSRTDTGIIGNGLGLGVTVLGTIAGGWAVSRLGMARALLIFGATQILATLSFAGVAAVGHHYPALAAAVALENFFSSMGATAATVFMMSLCDKRYTATQFALLSGCRSLSRVSISAVAGYLSAALGWPGFFMVCSALALPGVFLATRAAGWARPAESPR